MTDIRDIGIDRKLQDSAARADAVEGMRQGLDDSVKGRVRPVTEFFAEFETKHGIPALP